MNEPTTDEKIQQLVRAVLDAVDSRLDTIRHELAVFSGDVERRHHEMLDALASLERRVDQLEHDTHGPPPTHTEAPPADLSAISKPLYTAPHITTQLPAITDPAIQQITSLAIPPAVPPTMSSPTRATPAPHVEPPTPHHDITEEIDLEQLTNLLNERLGHLTLPPQTDD